MRYETSNQIIAAAEQLKKEAKSISNREEHAAWWDRKVEVLSAITNSLETGGLSEEARNDLHYAGNLIYTAEAIAGRYSLT